MTGVRRYLVLTVSLLSGIAPYEALAEEKASVYSVQGTVEIRRHGGTTWEPASVSSTLNEDDSVRTAAASRAAIVLASGVMVRLGQRSLFRVASGSGTESLHMEHGEAHFLSRKPNEFPTITTPVVSAAIRGTEFSVKTTATDSRIALIHGAVHLENNFGVLDITGGELATVKGGEAPVKALLVDRAEEIQWALYYPNLISAGDLSDFAFGATERQRQGILALSNHDPDSAEAAFGGNDWRDVLGHSLVMVERGESGKALSLLSSIASVSPSVDIVTAAIYLERGAVDEVRVYQKRAQAGIDKLPADQQRSLRAITASQKAVIEMVENRGDAAKNSADVAYEANPASSSAAMTLAYVHQSEGDLEEAKRIIDRAIEKSPHDYSLLARQADLLLSFGDSKEALKKATEAVEHMPESSYALTVKGFSQLARGDVDGAHDSFSQATKRSSGDGLPYLGLGLTEIRRGDLKKGRLFIQQAAHLEPQRALYRSYLGKALFEEEEEGLAAEEYERAIELDPEDPTPYLYRSFYELSTNRPVQALDDIEKSISINENRAIYRSSLLLDQDLSVRSNSLAQVYDSLGFGQVSRIEAIKSLSRDYANYSAHLLLSQSYEGTDDLIQGSISEFFISRLLSPVNFNLIRPSQSAAFSSNEYNAVFDRDLQRRSVDVNGNTRDKSINPMARISGTEGKLGYALNASAKYADGFRALDSENEQTVYGTLQYQLTPDDTILFDANGEVFDNGDTTIEYDSLSNDPDAGSRFDDYILRFGFNHSFGPGNIVIGQVLRNHSNFRIDDSSYDRLLYAYALSGEEVVGAADVNAILDQRILFRSDGTRGDMQHIYNSAFVSNVLGGGILDSTQKLEDTGTVYEPEELSGTDVYSYADNTEGSQRFFDYTTLHLTPWADFQMGVSYSKLHLSGSPLVVPFQDTTRSQTKWDPKVGLVLTPLSKTTVRTAYFESIGSAGVRELELIEPTILSGFNQSFFDIIPGTMSRNLAFGIDQKLDTKTYFGVEGLQRKLTRDYTVTVSSLYFDANDGSYLNQDIFAQGNDSHVDEDVVKAYLYQVLGKSTTATLDYQWNRDQDNLLGTDVQVNRVRGGLNYFHPSGLILFARGTWRGQDLDGYEDALGDDSHGFNDFWIVDCGAGYRFPKRHGQVIFSLNNLLDENYRYLPTGIDTPILPGFGGSVAFSYNF